MRVLLFAEAMNELGRSGLILVEGRIKLDAQEKRERLLFWLDDLSIDGNKKAGEIFVNSNLRQGLQRGDRIILRGKLRQTGIKTRLYGEIVSVQKPKNPDYFLQLRNRLSRRIQEVLPEKTAGLGLGYLLGEKFMIEESLVKDFNKSGLSHVIVASGFALSVLVQMFSRIFRQISKFAETSFALLAMSLFVAFTGLTPSMTRAFLATGLSMTVGYFGRDFHPARLILIVICLSLVIEPNNLWQTGWQLSFAAFFGISILAPFLKKYFYGEEKMHLLADILLTSTAAQICCLPISLFYFGTFSLAGIVSNLIIPPLLGVTMLLVLLAGILGGPFTWIANLLLEFHIEVVRFFAKQSWLQLEIETGKGGVWLVTAGVLVLFIFLRWRTKYSLKMRLKLC